ncbi:hypothetical protein BH10BAC4_BH10BAC4_03280 [soil metagenome]
MLHKTFISLLFIISVVSSSIAQDNKKDTIPGTKETLDVVAETIEEKRLYSLGQFGKESALFVKQPLRWQKKTWRHVGIMVGGTALLTLADEPLRNSTQGNQRYYNSFLIEGGRMYGEAYSIGGVAGAFGLYGLIARDTVAKKIAIELFQAGLYSAALTEALKVIVGRARPYTNEGHGSFHPFTFLNVDYNSFPSGHSTSAFALSTVLSRHAKSVGLKILAYLPAGLTLFSRIYQDKHWISDELIGAAIGYFVGNWVADLHGTTRHRINVTSAFPIGISIALN